MKRDLNVIDPRLEQYYGKDGLIRKIDGPLQGAADQGDQLANNARLALATGDNVWMGAVLSHLMLEYGVFVRSNEPPWTDPKDVSRDQLLPVLIGMRYFMLLGALETTLAKSLKHNCFPNLDLFLPHHKLAIGIKTLLGPSLLVCEVLIRIVDRWFSPDDTAPTLNLTFMIWHSKKLFPDNRLVELARKLFCKMDFESDWTSYHREGTGTAPIHLFMESRYAEIRG